MTDLWLPAFSDLSSRLADVAPETPDVRSIAREANVNLRAVTMPQNPLGAWEAVISAAQGQDRLLALHAVLAARYREWPRVFAAITRSRESLIAHLAAETDDQAEDLLIRDHIWREVGNGVSLDELSPELRRMQSAAAAVDEDAEKELGEAATAADRGDGGVVVSRLARARRVVSVLADKVGAPLVTEVLKRLLFPPAA